MHVNIQGLTHLAIVFVQRVIFLEFLEYPSFELITFPFILALFLIYSCSSRWYTLISRNFFIFDWFNSYCINNTIIIFVITCLFLIVYYISILKNILLNRKILPLYVRKIYYCFFNIILPFLIDAAAQTRESLKWLITDNDLMSHISQLYTFNFNLLNDTVIIYKLYLYVYLYYIVLNKLIHFLNSLSNLYIINILHYTIILCYTMLDCINIGIFNAVFKYDFSNNGP
jgi:hypothetical protein